MTHKAQKPVRTFDRHRGDDGSGHALRGGKSKLRCGTGGEKDWVYRHISSEHRAHWERDTFLTGKDWRTHTDWAIDLVLVDPDKVSYKADNDTFVYCRQIVLATTRGHVLGHKYPNVVVAAEIKKSFRLTRLRNVAEECLGCRRVYTGG